MYINFSSTDARVNWFQILKQIKKEHKVFRIASKHGDAVILAQEEYENLLNHLATLSEHKRTRIKRNQPVKKKDYSLRIVYLQRTKSQMGGA